MAQRRGNQPRTDQGMESWQGYMGPVRAALQPRDGRCVRATAGQADSRLREGGPGHASMLVQGSQEMPQVPSEETRRGRTLILLATGKSCLRPRDLVSS